MIRLAILDIDGTLLDSNEAHANAWVSAFAEAGISVSFKDVRPLIGMGGDLLVPQLTTLSSDSAQTKKLGERQAQIFREKYLATLQPFPAARDLLLRLKQDGIRLVIATSANQEIIDALLTQAGVRDLIDDIAKRQSDDSSKPCPDLIERALEQAKVEPDEAVMIGDTVYDVQAAKRARVRAIALTCGGSNPQDLKGADAIHRDPRDLLAHLSRAPEFTRPQPTV